MKQNFKFDGSEGGVIPEPEARDMINNYKSGPAVTWNQGVVGHFFGKDLINDILSEPEAMGIRVYYGSTTQPETGALQPQLIMVGVDEDGEDLLDKGKIVDISRPCPIFCPKTNGLALP